MAGVERRQLVRAVADDGNALGLKILERQAEVENAFCTCAHDHDGGVAQLLKVGGDVHGDLCATVHAADAAGGKNADACHVGDHHGGGDGGGTVCLAGDEGCDITAAGLGNISAGLAEIFDLVLGQTRFQSAAYDGDGGGDCTVFTDGLLDEQSGLHIARVGHTVRNDGAFKSNNGLAAVESFRYLG